MGQQTMLQTGQLTTFPPETLAFFTLGSASVTNSNEDSHQVTILKNGTLANFAATIKTPASGNDVTTTIAVRLNKSDVITLSTKICDGSLQTLVTNVTANYVAGDKLSFSAFSHRNSGTGYATAQLHSFTIDLIDA